MYISNRRDFLNKIIKVFSMDKKLKLIPIIRDNKNILIAKGLQRRKNFMFLSKESKEMTSPVSITLLSLAVLEKFLYSEGRWFPISNTMQASREDR